MSLSMRYTTCAGAEQHALCLPVSFEGDYVSTAGACPMRHSAKDMQHQPFGPVEGDPPQMFPGKGDRGEEETQDMLSDY